MFNDGMLVEREHFLASLTGILDESVAGAGRLVFLGGEAGVGKTTLLNSFVAIVAGRVGIRRGGCDNVTTPAALGPFVEALPELGDAIEESDRVDRLGLFRRLRDLAAGEPTVILLEDVHWADEATLDMLRVIARRLDQLPLLVIATFREDEVARSHPLTVMLGDIATLSGVVRMQLPALTLAGVRQLVEANTAALDAGEVYRNTGGNPFYVTEVLAAGGAQVPATVRDAVLARAGRLSPAAQRVLSAAAVLGPRCEVGLLTRVSSESLSEVDECVQLGVLIADGTAVAFRHELARLAIEQTLSPSERIDLHAAALRTLGARSDIDDRTLAHHAAQCGDRAVVVERAPRAAARSARLGAHREAAELYRLALRFTSSDDELARAELYTALSYECYLTDQLEEAHAAREEAMQIAERAGDVRAVGTGQRWLSRLSWFLGRNDESERWAVDAIATLEPLGKSNELAMAYSNMSQLRMLANEADDAVRWGERAIELAQHLDDREVEMHALNNVGTALCFRLNDVEGSQLLAKSLDLALAAGAIEHAARAYTNLGSIAIINRRYAEGDRSLRAGITYCFDHDVDSWRLYMSSWLARSLLEQGRTTAAEAVATDVLRHPHLSPITEIGASVVAGLIEARRGGDGAAHLARALKFAEDTRESQRLAPVAAARAELAWLDDRTGDIVAEIDRAWAATVAHPQAWELGELCWWLAVAGERRDPPASIGEPFALMLAGEWHAAADAWQRINSPVWAAMALGASAELADARIARELLDAAGAPATWQAIVRDRRARELPVPRGPRSTSRANTWGLTAREAEILLLLVEGLSNAELAQRLFLSEKTVGHHVSAILRKLGEPTRSRAVATAIREGIVAK